MNTVSSLPILGNTPPKHKKRQTRGVILYRGPSAIDGAPIVVVATGLQHSANKKTGNMVQVYILRADMHPVDARRTGADSAICGDCPLRTSGKCYVQLWNAPSAIWASLQRDNYPVFDKRIHGQLLSNRAIRLGAYGDPASMPISVVRMLARYAYRMTGYTHQWANPRFSPLKVYCMASVESQQTADSAKALGWRYFRVLAPNEPKGHGECNCPASKGAHCESCGACNGLSNRSLVSISIPAHGGLSVMSKWRKS